MNRTLLLLNALALIAVVGLAVQGQSVAALEQARSAPAMRAQVAVFDRAAANVAEQPRALGNVGTGRITF
ncbi:hypothetical protein D3C77_89450 [compost metagenome]|uniref:hypothetical protein n=1 Tax=Pseudomonas TaxID=286 RepID=UPI0003FB088F|nr:MULTISPECIES: hypothetical protein [Pseudomonas]MCW2267505.1 hypothetical protein [Pseudomonas sp. JUb96]PRA69551.1 hypothetical protein CQ065_08230 [Pseudomonas sp. MYb187]